MIKKAIISSVILFFGFFQLHAQKVNSIESIDVSTCVYCNNTIIHSLGRSSAIGESTNATGLYSFASGIGSTASGDISTAIGYYSDATGLRAVAIGDNTEANGSNSLGIGVNVIANASGSIAIGSGTSLNALTNNITNSIFLGANSTTPSICVLPASGTNSYGFVGIGTTSPQHALEVNGDIKNYGNHIIANGKLGIGTSSPEADLQVDGLSRTQVMQITENANDGYVFTCIDKGGEGTWVDPITLGLWTQNASDIFYQNGNVGIGVSNPASLLHVNGVITASDIITGSFQLETVTESGAILTCDNSGNARWTSQNQAGVWKRDNKNVFLDESGTTFHVGINTDNPIGHLQIGDRWCMYDNVGSSKILSNNYIWDQTNGAVRMADGAAQSIKFSNSGVLQFCTAGYGLAGANIDYNYMEMDENGYVSMGKIDPQVNLDIKGDTMCKVRLFNDSNYESQIWVKNNQEGYGLGVDQNGIGHIYKDYDSPVSMMKFNDEGQIIIGSQPFTSGMNTYGLYVENGIQTTDVKISEVSSWSDFVFDDAYTLRDIKEMESYITENNHLPDIPTEEEVKRDGYTVSEMDAKLLQKIEELMLYVIEQQHEIDALKSALENQK